MKNQEAPFNHINRKISTFTVQRLFLYYRALLESRQTKVISSEELSKLTGFSAAQIRKDLSYFGEFGTPGRGYNVEELCHEIKGILGIDREWEIALVGVGNLGKALLTYSGLQMQGFKISQLFDSDPAKIGKTCVGLKIKDIKTIKQELQNNPVRLAIVTVPTISAQPVINMLIESGVKAILNFTPTKVSTPPSVKVLNIDMTNELARLSYYLTQSPNPEIAGDIPQGLIYA